MQEKQLSSANSWKNCHGAACESPRLSTRIITTNWYTPGKDSWKHRDAGAAAVGILSPHMIAAFVPCERSEADSNGYKRLSRLLSDCDLLLVEGDLSATAFKLEVWRPEIAEPPYAQSNARIHVVISDVPVDVRQPIWPRSDVPEITDRILERIGIQFS